ncbi:19448_t:CDS:2, partial [Dentiscutata erythropus]
MAIIKKILILYIALCTISLVIAVPSKRVIQKRAEVNTNLFQAFTPQPATTQPTVHEYDFHLYKTSLSPDGVSRVVWTVNGQYPGPMIIANKGDQIVINVTNQLGEPTSIHSHGIVQKGTNWFDGVPGVTQCPIPNGGSFIYNYTVDQAGTYWYHSHYVAQYVDGMNGPIIVQDPNDPFLNLYDFEYVVTISEWYHNTTEELLAIKMAPTYKGFNPIADSALIGGIGQYNCSSAAAQGLSCNSSVTPPTYVVQSGKRYRFRIINTSADSHFHFSIDNHSLTLIEVDGISIKPVTIQKIPINVAQRYSVVLNASQPVGNYFIRASITQACIVRGNATTLNQTINYNSSINWNATGILHYVGADNSIPTSHEWPDVGQVTCDDVPDSSLVPYVASTPPTNISSSSQFSYNLTFGPDAAGLGIFYINNSSFTPNYTNPTIMQLRSGVSAQNLPTAQNAYAYNTANGGVELNFLNSNGGTHPFHLHGHSFYIVGRGLGTTPNTTSFNLVNPPFRDTATVSPGGWMTIRFYADNPGAWLVHCHLEWHVEMGMVIQLVERASDLNSLTLPSSATDL